MFVGGRRLDVNRIQITDAGRVRLAEVVPRRPPLPLSAAKALVPLGASTSGLI
jgi:hypothetical protein